MTDRARTLLAVAVSLHVLEPDDLRGHHGRPDERASELCAEGLLDNELLAALERLLEQEAPAACGTGGTLSPERGRRGASTALKAHAGRRHEAAPRIDPDRLATLARPDRDAISGAAFARLLARDGLLSSLELPVLRDRARQDGARVEDLLSSEGVVDPLTAMSAFAEAQVVRPTCTACLLPLGEARTCPAHPQGPEASPLEAEDVRARKLLAVAVSLHVLEPDDLRGHHARAQERLRELREEGLITGEALEAIEDLLEERSLAPERVERRVTISPARDLQVDEPDTATLLVREERLTRHHAAPRIDPDEVSLLAPALRDALAGSAFARQLVLRGALTREELADRREAARDRGLRLEDALVEAGVADALVAMEVFAAIQVTRPTCLRCLLPLASSSECRPAAPAQPSAPEPVRSGTVAGSEDGLPVAESSAPLAGTRFGDYELEERIGEGGMGVVFRAQDRRLNRMVALKVMRAGPLAPAQRRQRFLQEAEAVAALHHRNIVPIHQIGELQGYPYYTMEFVDGTTIDEHVQAVGSSPAEVAELLRQVAEGVHHFHSRGIIHRDLKPDNVLVNAQGVPQIIDFGIAKKVSGDAKESWTVEGDLMGTPHYMSPEQAAGRNQDVDIRSDIYALGTILYELLAGEPPFAGRPQQPRSLRVANAEVDTDLRAIVGMAMAKEPDRRYGSALELTQDLARYGASEPIHARPATLRYRFGKLIRRRRRAVAACGVALCLIVGVAAWLYAQEQARQAQVDELLRAALDAPLAERPDLFSRALGLDPGNEFARLQRQAAERELELERSEAERRRLDAERVKRERALLRVQQLERERELARARAAVEAAEARERARREAVAQARVAAEGRASRLLTTARRARDPLNRIAHLDQALLLVGEYQGALYREVARAKLQVVLALAGRAIGAEQVGLAQYWLRQASGLTSDERHPRLKRLRRQVTDLVSGKQLHETARRLIRQQDWLAAREKLEQATERGYQPALVRQDQALVERRCAARARALAAEARRLLRAERPLDALAQARAALRYLRARARGLTAQLVEECAGAAARGVQLRCLRLFDRPGRQTEALSLLVNVAGRLSGTQAGKRLQEELKHRARLLQEGTRAALVYVPAHADQPAFCVQRTEVTNKAYRAFVQGGGYADPSLFDRAARAHLPELVDSTGRPGPRTWREGSFGDARNGGRPVRGVSWWEARAYARWRTRVTKRRWRLPSREEWERAAGWDPEALTVRRYPWGAGFDPRVSRSAAPQPLPVGTLRIDRSPLGVLDAGGSVCEWVLASREREAPLLKGSRYAADRRESEHAARVRACGRPGPNPPRELCEWIGFRLIQEVEE